ncbi:DUF3616 domain-containing protein [Variovorax rhizosphaerae]|uniref:DUF3616 domain-containing protein n=1 Tax=Variovorax rhizosphaerae TaxID=1836200 RepID=A0ABU8WNJ3_9BURK
MASFAMRGVSFALAGMAMLCVAAAPTQEVLVYRGTCDASAASALGPDHFVMASDEDNILRIYRHGQPEPVSTLSLAAFLGSGDEESDIEGAATVGNRIYWITSHGRNKNAKPRPARQRFFATDFDVSTTPPTLRPVGKAYAGLQTDLLATPEGQRLGLAQAAQRAPEAEGGFNIESLAATPKGPLLVGFRNPLIGREALVMPLLNPQDVLEGRPSTWGAPIQLPLGRRGLRSMETMGAGYLLVAGPTADAGSFALFRWSGQPADGPVPLKNVDLGTLRPEALFTVPGSGEMQLLSDDGGLTTGGVECKARPAAERTFRSLRFSP